MRLQKTKMQLLYFLKFSYSIINYSSLSASIGFILTALCAGIMPISVPITVIINSAPKTNRGGTVGLVYGNSAKSGVKKLIVARAAAPKIIPHPPAIDVSHPASKTL